MGPAIAKLFGKRIALPALRLRSNVWTTMKISTMSSSLMKAQSGWSAMEKYVSEKRKTPGKVKPRGKHPFKVNIKAES